MEDTIVVTGDYGYEQFRLNGTEASVIDASDATWIVANQGSPLNLYPVLIDRSDAAPELIGGEVNGTISLTGEWTALYENSAAVMVRNAEDATIRDWTITRAWDGVRVAGEVDGFLIDNIYMRDIRDDAIENDYGASGTISNSLFDGVFSGISMTKPDLPDLRTRHIDVRRGTSLCREGHCSIILTIVLPWVLKTEVKKSRIHRVGEVQTCASK